MRKEERRKSKNMLKEITFLTSTSRYLFRSTCLPETTRAFGSRRLRFSKKIGKDLRGEKREMRGEKRGKKNEERASNLKEITFLTSTSQYLFRSTCLPEATRAFESRRLRFSKKIEKDLRAER